MLRNTNGYSDYQPVTPPGDKPLPTKASSIAVAGIAAKASPIINNNNSNINDHGQLNRTPSLDGTTIRGSPPNNTINTQNMTSASSTNMTSHTLRTNNTGANRLNNSSANLIEVKKNSSGSDTGRGSLMEGIQRASPVEILRASPPVEVSNNLNQNNNPSNQVSSPFEASINRTSLAVEGAAAAVIRGFQTIERHVDERLEHETEETLLRRIKADIVVMCQERGLPAEGEKKVLIQALLDWQKAKPVPGPSTPKLCSIQPAMVVQNKAPINTVYLNSLLQDGNFQGEIAYEQLTVGKKLGSGGFKDCYAGTYMGEAVAIGELRVQNFTEMDIQEMKHEINVLKQLRHENIIRFIGVCTNVKHLCIVTELCENGDLYDFMRKTKKPTFGRLIMYMHDIALACAYLHTRRPSIIHRDMKSMNVLISSDDRAKINDFGLARIRPRANASLHTQCGTPNWQAPEFWSPNPRYTEKVDVYACGLIYWEILSWAELGYPYHNLTEHQLYEAVRDKEERPPLEKLKKYPQSLLSLIQDMWRKDPKKRPSMSHVVDRLADYLE
ncbi:hypothetical protein BGZ67_004676 [Mortierella alpina]|nr:hypothetical protein BGZ67_004676 [Mortierella alpina]